MVHRDDRGAQSWNGVHVTHRTTVAQIVRKDGSSKAELAGASPFPRHYLYDTEGRLTGQVLSVL